MSTTDDLLAANRQFAAIFTRGHLPRPPKRKVAILTCLDARIDPLQALGLEDGDAAIIRNAGGRAADARRSLAISHVLLGVRQFVVIHHTDCGLDAMTNEAIRERFGAERGDVAGIAAAEVDFLPFADLDQSVRDDVDLIRNSPLIPGEVVVRGFVYDVRTGVLREVL